MPKYYIFKNGNIVLNSKTALPRTLNGLGKYFVRSGIVDRENPEGDRWAELTSDCELPKGWISTPRRNVSVVVGEEEFFRIGKAFQLMDWRRTTRFCGACGHPLLFDKNENAMRCPKCKNIEYPVISPAIIVAVEREGKILLGHNKGFKQNWYSTLAGFAESGETLEECVKREVYEETKIKVMDIKYFGSQPWAFPRSLMIGFTAKWESGEIDVDGAEISDAGWFAPDEMPPHPESVSIASCLIADFVKRNSDK